MRFEDLGGKDFRAMAPGPDCLSDARLARVAAQAGAGADELDHVAQCDWCGTRLKMILETEDLSPEEQELVERLSRPRATVIALPRPRVSRWLPVAAGLAAVFSGGSFWLWRANTVNRPATLLARAYTESRQIEWRLPDAGWTQPGAQRSGSPFRNPALAEAEALLTRQDGSNDPRIAILQARAALLDFRIEAAITLLDKAVSQAPDWAEALTDLAVAHALRADRLGQPEGYGAAIEYSTRALRLEPGNSRALYNRALAFERLNAFERALEEWKAYVQSESRAEWVREGRRHIEEIERRIRERGSLLKDPGVSDVAYEGLALEWLVNNRPRAEAAGKRLQSAHGDTWLAHAAAESADSRLALEAWRLIVSGKPDDALAVSAAAISRFASGDAQAHHTFARLTRVFALNRKLDLSACAGEAKRVAEDAARLRYRWIEVQSTVQAASCLLASGDLGAGLTLHETAVSKAAQAKLTGAQLSAAGIYTTARTRTGDLWSAWKDGRSILGQAYGSPYSTARIQQSLSTFSLSAEAWGWPAAAAEFAAAAADSVRDRPNRTTEMANRSRSASLAVSAGLSQFAEKQSATADAYFRGMPESETKQRYLAALGLTKAEGEINAGRPEAAADELQRLGSGLTAGWDRWRGQLLLGRARRQSSKEKEAVEAFQLAVQGAEAMAQSMPPRGRAAARREAIEGYRALAEMLLDRGDTAGALRVWLSAHGSERSPAVVLMATGRGYALWSGGGNTFQEIRLDRKRFQLSVSQLLEAVANPATEKAQVMELVSIVHQDLFRHFAALLHQPDATFLPDAEASAVPLDLVLASAGGGAGPEAVVIAPQAGEPPALAPKRPLIIASPLTPAHLAPLPDSLAEGEEIAAMWPGSTVLSGGQAKPEGLLREFPKHDVFHFSGHGFMAPGTSGLWLSGGPIGAEGLRFIQGGTCQLAVLSACMTAAGARQGFAGPQNLVQAFLDAGVPSVLASRWNAHSAATRVLMREFYRQLATTGSARRSLARATAALRSETIYSHPYYWAGFQLYSRGGN